MKVSFDGLRMNIGQRYNALATAVNSNDQDNIKEEVRNLRAYVWTLLAINGDWETPQCKDLSEKIKLREVEE